VPEAPAVNVTINVPLGAVIVPETGFGPAVQLVHVKLLIVYVALPPALSEKVA
jgi:hypothetical protein